MGHLYTLMMHCVACLWGANISLITSNQPCLQAEAEAERFGIEFQHIPISKENKSTQERVEL
jgi:formyltetrahydrofolate hydrolase